MMAVYRRMPYVADFSLSTAQLIIHAAQSVTVVLLEHSVKGFHALMTNSKLFCIIILVLKSFSNLKLYELYN